MTDSREDITSRVRERLGPEATGEMVTSVVERVMELLAAPESESTVSTAPESPTLGLEQIRITARGASPQGILAVIQQVLADHHCQVLETSQTTDQERVTVELTAEGLPEQVSLPELQQALEATVQELTISISAKHQTGIQPSDD